MPVALRRPLVAHPRWPVSFSLSVVGVEVTTLFPVALVALVVAAAMGPLVGRL